MECDVSAIKGGEPRVGRAKAQREQPLRRLPCGECSASFNLARNLALHTAAQHSQDGNPLICPGSMTHHSQPNTRRKCPHSHYVTVKWFQIDDSCQFLRMSIVNF